MGDDHPLLEFHDVYVQYKQDTRAVVAWLIKQGSSADPHPRPATVSIRHLRALAERVIESKIELPATIDFLFREAIRARKLLSRIFRLRSRDFGHEETVNHEHFTASLCDIHAKLRERATTASRIRASSEHCCVCEEQQNLTRNRFNLLESGCTFREDTVRAECRESEPEIVQTPPEAPTVPPPNKETRLIDDTLADACELQDAVEVSRLEDRYGWIADAVWLQEMEELQDEVIHAWEQAAAKAIPITVAAFITDTAMAAFEDIEQRMKTLCGISDPSTLKGRLGECSQHNGSEPGTAEESSITPIGATDALLHPWRRLLNLKKSMTAHPPSGSTLAYRVESHVTLRSGTLSAAETDEFLDIILQDIHQHIRQTCLCTSIIRVGSPVLAEVGYFLTHDHLDGNGLRCSFGLELLLKGCRTYFLQSRPRCPSSSCRLAALQFAQEASPSVEAVLQNETMPCRCEGTLAFHLENLRRDFDAFLHSRVFDLYFQSPWVSGSHILEMHDALFYYGLCLFRYRNYVGSILHVYNMLRVLTDMPNIILLDRLQLLFKDELFPGGQPSRNFKNCYVRYLGGRLRFASAHKSKHRKGCHSIVIPAHTARTSAGFGMCRQNDDLMMRKQKVSLLHRIKNGSHYLDDETWKEVCERADEELREEPAEADSPKGTSPSRGHHGRRGSNSTPRIRLHKLRQALVAETTGVFPIFRINFFQIYLACADLVGGMSDKFHGEQTRPGQYCLCFVDTILMAADRVRDEGRSWQFVRCKELLDLCRRALQEGLALRELDEFLWKGG